MNSAKLNDWMQVIGIFALVASLIFVGLQMKQEQEIALSAAYQARTATLVEFLMTSATDDVTRSAMAKNMVGNADLTPDERVAAAMFSKAGIELLQNSHYQYVQGYLDEEHWQSVQYLIRNQLQSPFTRDIILGDGIRPSFRLVVEDIDRELHGQSN